MTRLMGWTVLVVLCAGVAWGATPVTPTPVATPATAMKDLERNMALGAALTHRDGSADELGLVQKLADRGLAAARELVAADPKSAEAQYVLGSWLLYGYHVVESESVFFDTAGGEHTEKVSLVAQGLVDSDTEGLRALELAHILAPENGRYFVDYGAALYDCDRPEAAMSVLKKVWVSTVKLAPQDKLRTALLMSDLLADQGEIADAREWVYRALTLEGKNQDIVARLRQLDRLQTEALTTPPPVTAPPPPAVEPESTAPVEEEAAPADESGPEEVAPEESEGATGEELAPDGEQPAPEDGAVGGDEASPEAGEDNAGS